MFTPSEILEKQFKAGLGYDKKDVEQFLHDLSSDFETLQLENNDLKKKQKELDENLGYYKSIEKTLQKALILAEKTAQDTRATAFREADAIEMEAKTKAKQLLVDSKMQIEVLEHKTLNLIQQYDVFKIHFENLLHAQIELLNSKSFSVNTDDFSYKDASNHMISDIDKINFVDAKKSLEAISEDANSLQEHFAFLEEHDAAKSYQTEDGFEFFTIKDE